MAITLPNWPLFAGLESIRVGHDGDTLPGGFLGLDVHTETIFDTK